MARILESSQLIRTILLLSFLTSACASPMYSQSSPANPIPPDTKPSQSSEGPKQPPVVDRKTELSPPTLPEETRQAQIEADTKKLYLLSAELRAEVAKTYKESLSLTVLKKAEEIEKLARSLKVLMNQEASAARH
jgi:hypothetical protein